MALETGKAMAEKVHPATKRGEADEQSAAYEKFNRVVFRWMRYIGRFVGQDILNDNFVINAYVVFRVLPCVALPLFYLRATFYDDSELGMIALGAMGTGIKVSLRG